MDGQARWFPEGSLADLPDIEADRSAFQIIGWELEPGDAVFFHMLALHAAGGADRRRRAFSIRFLGDDAVHAPRAWTTSPEFPGLVDELPAGAPMDTRASRSSGRPETPVPGTHVSPLPTLATQARAATHAAEVVR